MANEKKQENGWLDSKFDLPDAFGKERFDELIEYVNTNEHNLMRIWLNQDSKEIEKTLMLGTALLSYFEKTIEEDPKVLTVFKLGELQGYLNCLNLIKYERQQDRIARGRLATAIVFNNEYSEHFKKVILTLYNSNTSTMTEKKLYKVISLKLEDVNKVLNILCNNGLLNYYEMAGYTLNDMGIRLAKQLTKEKAKE